MGDTRGMRLKTKAGETALGFSEDGTGVVWSSIRSASSTNTVLLLRLAPELLKAIVNDEPVTDFIARLSASPPLSPPAQGEPHG